MQSYQERLSNFRGNGRVTKQRKKELRQQYLKAIHIVEAAQDRYSCDLTLMEYIAPPAVSEALRTLDRIRGEVRAAMAAVEGRTA